MAMVRINDTEYTETAGLAEVRRSAERLMTENQSLRERNHTLELRLLRLEDQLCLRSIELMNLKKGFSELYAARAELFRAYDERGEQIRVALAKIAKLIEAGDELAHAVRDLSSNDYDYERLDNWDEAKSDGC